VPTWHNDNYRTGQNLSECTLPYNTISKTSFGVTDTSESWPKASGYGFTAEACDVKVQSIDYFSFTKSKTKIAQTPTVIGNCAACASRNEPPRGTRKERQNIATAVSIPRSSLLFQVMIIRLVLSARPTSGATCSGRLPPFYAGSQLRLGEFHLQGIRLVLPLVRRL